MEIITTETNEMINLIRRYQSGDIAVREKLVEKNVDLVQALARKFCESDVAAVELYRIGWIGFWKAVDGFDPQSGIRFSTCAVPQIAGEIRKFRRASMSPEMKISEAHHQNSTTNT